LTINCKISIKILGFPRDLWEKKNYRQRVKEIKDFMKNEKIHEFGDGILRTITKIPITLNHRNPIALPRT